MNPAEAEVVCLVHSNPLRSGLRRGATRTRLMVPDVVSVAL